MAELGVSERFACRVLGQPRTTQRKVPRTADDEVALTRDIVALARQYGRYGYRRITALLRDAGWLVNKKRVERIWRQEGLKVPQRHPPPAFQRCIAPLEPWQAPPKRGRLWLNDGSCIRLRPEQPNHVWAYDFVEDRTHDGRKIRMLNIVDEFSREALAIRVERRLNSNDVIDVLSDLFILRGVPAHIRSDNGPEFIAKAVQAWITGARVQAELRGQSCIPLTLMPAPRQAIAVTRSFGRQITSWGELREAIAAFATRAAEKLRADGLEAGHLSVFAHTNPHNGDDWYSGSRAARIEPTADTMALIGESVRLLRAFWRPEFRYFKAGIMLGDLAPARQQAGLFSTRDIIKSARAMAALDSVNARFGSGTLRPAATGMVKAWAGRQARHSPRYTTRIEEMLIAKAF